MAKITVRHSAGRYPVIIQAGLVARLPAVIRRLAPRSTPIVVTDRTVVRVVATGWSGPRVVVPVGERSKSVLVWNAVIDRMTRHGLGRGSVVVAVGGGVIGDLAGFAAATYLRGIPVVQVPTTLLAMVDASVGGKTGLNTTFGKNLIGAFFPPLAVLIDPIVTRTQSAADFRAGLVEALKHGLIADRAYYRWIVRSAGRLEQRDPAVIGRLVRRSVAIKGWFVARDERDVGPRAALNAGHTVGHALEHASGYRLRHGDAVGLGLVVEAVLAARLGLASSQLAIQLVADLRALGIPLTFPRAVSDRVVMAAMRHDKKNQHRAIHCALVGSIGAIHRRGTAWTVQCPESAVVASLRTARNLVR